MALFSGRKQKNRHKAVLLGLDGVPFSLLKDLMERGRISHMTSLFEKGYFGPMSVCIPEISSVSWSCFMTGTQSGEHGIFGFMDLQPGTYNMYFPNYGHLKAPPMWDDLAEQGKKSVVINMPATYPARAINGALISGFVAIDINKAVYPSTYIQTLKEMDYSIDLDTTKARQDHDFLFRELDITLQGRERAVDFFWKEIDWDLFIVVITGTDRLMHFIWEAYEKKDHQYHQAFLDYFEKIDAFVGRLYDRFLGLEGSKKEQNRFFMLSDHGFTGVKTEVYINRWLQDNGYLKFGKDQPKSIMDIGPGSKAFALDPSRIYINLKDKYPLGTVDPSDYERVRSEIKDGLERLTFTEERILKNIYLKEELYKGPLIDQAPDLILLSNHGYDLKGKANSDEVFGRTNLEGMHTQDDAFFFSDRGTECTSIFDAKKIITDIL